MLSAPRAARASALPGYSRLHQRPRRATISDVVAPQSLRGPIGGSSPSSRSFYPLRKRLPHLPTSPSLLPASATSPRPPPAFPRSIATHIAHLSSVPRVLAVLPPPTVQRLSPSSPTSPSTYSYTHQRWAPQPRRTLHLRLASTYTHQRRAPQPRRTLHLRPAPIYTHQRRAPQLHRTLHLRSAPTNTQQRRAQAPP